MNNNIESTGPRSGQAGSGEPARPVTPHAELSAEAAQPRARNSAFEHLSRPESGFAKGVRGLRKLLPALPSREAQQRAKALRRARVSLFEGRLDHGDYAGILETIAQSITSDKLFDEPVIDDIRTWDPERAYDHLAHAANPPTLAIRDSLDARSADELRTVFWDMLVLSPYLPPEKSRRTWYAALARVASMLPDSNREQRMVIAGAREAWRGASIDTRGFVGILAILERATASANLKIDGYLLDNMTLAVDQLPDALRAAQGRSEKVADYKSAMRFAKRYLGPDKRIENRDRRAELTSALILRTPEILKASGKEKLMEFSRYIMQEVVSTLPAEQQVGPLIAFAKTAPFAQDAQLELHRDALNYARLAWRNGVISDEDYARFLAVLASAMGYRALFADQLLGESRGDASSRINDRLGKQTHHTAGSSNVKRIELRVVVAAMLSVTPNIAAEHTLDWLSAVGRMTCDLPESEEERRMVTDYAKAALAGGVIDLNGCNAILESLTHGPRVAIDK